MWLVCLQPMDVTSIHMIPGTILAEFKFHATFFWNCFINLAGNSAKFDSSGMPGSDWILQESVGDNKDLKSGNVKAGM